MHFVRRGSGPSVVLVHGLGSSLGNWDPVVPALAEERDVVVVDLPGFGQTPPLSGEVSIATLTDALARFLEREDLADSDIVGSSMGARMVLEHARRGHRGTTVALDPGGFWTDRQKPFFRASITASVGLVRRIQPLLPALTRNRVTRTLLMAQFSHKPWKLPPDLALQELRGFDHSPSLDEALRSLVNGPAQEGAPRGTLQGKVVIGWGRNDKVTLPSQSERALNLFPDASLHWFDSCGHFPHWDQPAETVRMILRSTG